MRLLLLLGSLALLLSTIACGAGAAVSGAPRWACPSPEPLPYGPDGPIKAIVSVPIGTATPTGDLVVREEIQYYAIWEQEYAALGGPPFASPTPYALVGTSYTFGQRVELAPLHVQVSARAGQLVAAPGIAPGSQQLYLIEIAWVSRARAAIPFDYQRVRLRAVTDPQGALISDQRWGVTSLALQLAGSDSLPTSIPPGASQVTVPVIAPPGTPEVVELTLLADPGSATGPADPAATSTAVVANPELRAADAGEVTIQWSNAVWRAPGAPPCGDAGALTDWSAGPLQVWGVPVPVGGVAAPPGSGRLVQLALNQVGKPYVWGAKGPERFDCSGLVSWAYAQVGITIPQGTAGQWPRMTAVSAGQAAPGDLVFFDIAGRGRIDHVAMLVGDLDGDGRMDIVHAASPELGVRVDYDVFGSPFYGPRVRGLRTARS